MVRCLKCGFIEDWGKYGIRLGAVGENYTLGWCSRCRWIRCHVIEKRKQAAKKPGHEQRDERDCVGQ